MSKRDVTSEIIEKVLLTAATGATIASALVLPGAIIGLEPLLEKAYKMHDKRQQSREYRRVIAHMRRQNLLKLEPRSGNGLIITSKGLARADRHKFISQTVPRPEKWDQRWRMVIFDIPEVRKVGRNQLIISLKRLGFYQLQRSCWVHPFPCREVIETVANEHKLADYLTYLETSTLDHETELRKQFKSIL